MDSIDDETGNGTGFKVAAMLFVGFLFLFIITALAYFTVEAAIGRIAFCTLWTDIPGRVAIFIISYYVAGVCGCLPIPKGFLLNCLPEPLMLWKLGTWRNIFRNAIYLNRLHINEQESSGLLVVHQEQHEQYFDCSSSLRRQSEPTSIVSSKEAVVPVNILPINAPKSESPITSKNSGESLMSFDSPVGGFIVPMVKRKSDKLPYLLGSCKRSSGSANEVTIDNESKVNSDTPPKTADSEVQLPDFPRFPWVFLRQKEVPKVAQEIHKRNLRIERREATKYVRRGKTPEAHASKRVESTTDVGWETDDNDDTALKRLPFRLPHQRLPSGRTYSRFRTRSTAGILEKCRPFKLNTSKSDSNKSKKSIDFEAGPSGTAKSKQIAEEPSEQTEKVPKCCKKSPDLHRKVERIQKLFSRFSQESQTCTEFSAMSQTRQNTERQSRKEVSKEIGGKTVHEPSSAAPVHSTQAESSEKPNVKMSIKKSSKEESNTDDDNNA